MKHVGKMKNNSARLVVVFRTLPGDPYSCLVVGTQGLGDSYHDTLMDLLQSEAGQQANELADILAVRRFPDGNVMLDFLHNRGHLRKIQTANVIMTPDSQTTMPLDELNMEIAKQRGIKLEDLCVRAEKISSSKTPAKQPEVESQPISIKEDISTKEFELSPSEMRSRADALFKQAQQLRKKADELDPPKSKKTKVAAE